MASRQLKIGIVGTSAGLGASAVREIVGGDLYLAATTGGAAAAVLSNWVLGFEFDGLITLALFGAVAGWAGAQLSDAFVGEAKGRFEVPLRRFVGSALGGGAGALSLAALVPPEFQLTT